MNLPISENKLQQLITDAKDFVYGLGKATEGILFDCVEMMLNATDAFVNDYIFFTQLTVFTTLVRTCVNGCMLN